MNDRELLQGYVRNSSQDAFAQLVERHVNLVYSTAHRLVHDTHLAEDVTQQVFTLLVRKAGRLGSDTILSAWLYRAARHVASETVRRESRRRRREQIAVESMSQSTTDGAWRQIEPLLDEAMAELSAADHDAVVLRYFENLPLKDVGAALGSSEDAAQKRVTRALERLRESLTGRGVTVSATALAAAITGEAVQSAPVGMAVSAASVSLAASAGSGLISSFLQIMATSNVKPIGTVVVIAGLSVSLVLLRNQNASLRRELVSWRASALDAPRLAATNRSDIETGVRGEELQRLRREHLELLSLRSRVTQLANELRQRKAAGAQATASANPTLEEKEPDTILFSASLTNRVKSGNTLVVGGWPKEGKRAYLLATPVIEPGDAKLGGRQLTVKSQIVGAPESFWAEIGWGSYKSDTRRSTLALELTAEEVDSLLNALKEARDAGISIAPPATAPEGERIVLGWNRAEDNESESGMLMGVDVYPRIATDGPYVDLEILPHVVSSNAALHGSLRQAAGPTSSPPR